MALTIKTNNKLVRRLCLSLTFLLCVILNDSYGQLITNNTLTPQQLVEDVLLGVGVTVSNITYTGGNVSRGQFSTGPNPTNLGITGGVILASGNISTAIGPNTQTGAGTDLNLPGDPLLTSIANQQTHDAAVLEFDFVPQFDTLKFRYVFGSDEYPEYVTNLYNDIFGFFITGLNPATYLIETNKNVAIVPGTTNTPVSIGNINNVIPSYPQYYVNNQGGATIEYDGFTTVLTAWCLVVPCTNYHIKIAIADALDGILDSGVFLEQGSFSSGGINYQVSYSNPTISLDAVEGCNQGIISFKLPYAMPLGYFIPFSTGGTAINGVDYVTLTGPLLIPPNQDSAAIVIDAIIDGIPEGNETVEIVFPNSICLTDYDTVTINITDYQPLHANLGSDTTIYCGDTIFLHAGDTGGIAPYNYQWSSGLSNADSLLVWPLMNTMYSVTVSDVCNISSEDSIWVNVYGPTAYAGEDTTICQFETVTLTATGGVDYIWSNGATTQSIQVSPNQTTTYYVTVADMCYDIDSVTVFVNPLPVVTATSSVSSICPGDTCWLLANEPLDYLWTSFPTDPSLTGQDTLAQPFVHPDVNTTYTLFGTDNNGCTNSTTIQIAIKPVPSSSYIANPDPVCEGENTIITYTGNGTPGSDFSWDFHGGYSNGTGQGPYEVHWYTTGYNRVSLTVTQDGCSSPETVDSVLVNPLPKVSFTAENTEGCPPLEVSFIDNSDDVLPSADYFWEFGNGDQSGLEDPVYTYYKTGVYNVTLTIANQNGCDDTKTIQHLVNVYPVPEADFIMHPAATSIFNPVVKFYDRSTGNPVSWLWDLGDGNSSSDQDIQHMYSDTGYYDVILTILNSYGCPDTISRQVLIQPDFTFYVPNSFTPNKDGSNDIFYVYGLNVKNFDMRIFSRWGEMVYNSFSIDEGWDGTFKGSDAPSGTYVVVIYYKDVFGKKHSSYSHVSLIR